MKKNLFDAKMDAQTTAIAVDTEKKSFLQSLIEETYKPVPNGVFITPKGYERCFCGVANYEYINFLLVKSFVSARPFLPEWVNLASQRIKCDSILLVPDMRELVQNTIVDCIALAQKVNGKAIVETCWKVLDDFVIKTGYQQRDCKTLPKVELTELELVIALQQLCDKTCTDTPEGYKPEFITALTNLFNEVKKSRPFFSPQKWSVFKCIALNMPSDEICQLFKLTKQALHKHKRTMADALIDCLKAIDKDDLSILQNNGLFVD